MKKFFLSFSLIITFVFYVLYQRIEGFDNGIAPVATEPVAPGNDAVPAHILSETPSADVKAPRVSPAKPKAGAGNSAVPVPVGIPRGLYRDGAYVGDVADAYYGNVQIKAIIRNGKISDVRFLDYPQDRRTSMQISNFAMPRLTREAIQAQSAEVDVISGATQTSRAFNESLASALLQAKN